MELFLLFVMVIGLMLVGVPIAVSLGLPSVLFLIWFSDSSMASVAQTLFEAFEGHATLLAIPFFILASSFMSTGGVAIRIIRFSIALVGHFRGGLAIAGVLACMIFAALSGSSPATVVAIGSIVIAAMTQAGYTKEFAAGVICNAGTLGILIPPSIVMVVYAAAVEVSVGRMFLAGVIPGLLAGSMLMIGIYIMARVKNMPAGDWAGWGEVGESFADAFWGLMLIVIIMVGIYGVPGVTSAIFTPTEAAAVASIYAFLVACFFYQDLGPFAKGRAKAGLASTILIFGPFLFAGLFKLIALLFGLGGSVATFLIIGLGASLILAKRMAQLKGTSFKSIDIASDIIKMPSALVHKDTLQTLFDAGKLVVTLMFVIANALLLKHVITDEQVPQKITEAMLGFGFGPVMFLIVVNIILLIGGQFMEPSGLLVIVAPLVFPIAIELGIDPIHLGIIMVVNMEIGMITPPVGLNLFVTSGVAGMPMMAVVRAALPFLGIMFIFLIMVTYIPAISTTLPNAIMGPEIITK